MSKRKRSVSFLFLFIEEMIAFIGGIAVFLMMLLIVTDVITRNFFNSPIKGQMEVVELLMIIAIFFGLSYTQKTNGHIGIDFIHKYLKGTFEKVVNFIVVLCSIFINVLITVYVFKQVLGNYQRGVATIYLQWPMWIVNLFVFIGMLLLSVRLIIEMKSVFQLNSTSSEEGDHYD